MDPLLDPPFSYYAVYNINHIVHLLSSWTPIRPLPSVIMLFTIYTIFFSYCLHGPLLDPPFSYYPVYNINHIV